MGLKRSWGPLGTLGELSQAQRVLIQVQSPGPRCGCLALEGGGHRQRGQAEGAGGASGVEGAEWGWEGTGSGRCRGGVAPREGHAMSLRAA